MFWPTSSKILAPDLLVEKVTKLRKYNRIIFTNGCFDILHAGHLHILEEAKDLGGVLIVGVNTDESVKGLKGDARPINACETRMRLLAGLSCVDYVTFFNEPTPIKLIRQVVPEILVKGGDYEFGKVVGEDIVLAAGGRLVLVPLLDGFSTTKLIDRLSGLGR